MKSIYKNLARNALSKNKIVYVPYIISSIMMITISFIIFNLAVDKVIGSINGGASLQMMMTQLCYPITWFIGLYDQFYDLNQRLWHYLSHL